MTTELQPPQSQVGRCSEASVQQCVQKEMFGFEWNKNKYSF